MIPRKYVKFQNTIYMYIRCCNWFLCHYNKKGRVPAPFFNSNFATTTKKTIIVSLFQTFHNLFDSYVSSFHGTSKTKKKETRNLKVGKYWIRTTNLYISDHGFRKHMVVPQMFKELLGQNDVMDKQTMVSSDDLPLSRIHGLSSVSPHCTKSCRPRHKILRPIINLLCGDLIRVIDDTSLSSSEFLTKFSIVKYI